MNHYTDREYARQKWEERKQRINWDNLFIMMYTEDPRDAEQFDMLPYKKKVCFTNFQSDLASTCFLEISQHPMFKERQAFYFISGIAQGQYMFYDPWELLMNGNHSGRWSFGQHS